MTAVDDDTSRRPSDSRDAELLDAMHQFQGGSDDAFETVYRRLWRPVAARVGRMGLRGDLVDELTQKALVRVYLYARKATFDSAGRLWGWVLTIATREVYKHWRKRRPDLAGEDALEAWSAEAAAPAETPADAAETAETDADARDCLGRLEDDARRKLAGVLVGGLTFRAAAAAEGLTLGQFKHRYEKALARVRDCMRAKGHDVR